MNEGKKIQVLIIEDELAHADMICRNLEATGTMSTSMVNTLDASLERIAESTPDIVLIDLHLPDGSALDFLHHAKGKFPVLTLTARGTEAQAVEVLKAGAIDYIIKSADTFDAMPRIVERALREWQLQQQNEQAITLLRSSEQRFRMLLQNVQSVAVQGYRADGTAFYWNRASEELYGYSAAEAIGNSQLDLIIPVDYREKTIEKITRLVEAGTASAPEEMTVQHKDGSPLIIYSSCVVVSDNDRPPEIYCIDVDITARKKAEDALFASRENLRIQHEQLEQANRDLKQAHVKQLQSEKMASIGQLAAGVAHEINNPIGFVSSNLGSLERYLDKLGEFIAFQDHQLADQIPAQLHEKISDRRKQLKIDTILADIGDLLAESRDGVNRVGKIVSDLKGFSRIDEAEHKTADIIECLESSINIVWNEIKYKATLTRDFADLPKVLCYPGQLNQVFVNLLVNAAQAIKAQGTIDLKAWSTKDHIYIRITDSGCGISEENLRRIFDPFFTTKEIGKGTGLGLSISYDIIKKHQGEIIVESREEEGTSFTIKLPIRPDESEFP